MWPCAQTARQKFILQVQAFRAGATMYSGLLYLADNFSALLRCHCTSDSEGQKFLKILTFLDLGIPNKKPSSESLQMHLWWGFWPRDPTV